MRKTGEYAGSMRKWIVMTILALSQFVMVLDSTVMNVSISTVAKDLGTTISGMQAAITFYALTMAALMLTGGKLGDIWGRHRAFTIGSLVYGIGSLITGLSQSLGSLLFGWSLVEGLGAVLVIPAIVALTAVNYKGKDRIVAFSILGATTGIAAAIGPLIGGLVTTYFSWRYVFIAEAVIMAVVLMVAGNIKDVRTSKNVTLDVPSVFLSALGMGTLVFGVLQSKTWGWIQPTNSPIVNGQVLAPFGVSIVITLIIIGIITLYIFMARQRKLEREGKHPLLKVSLLRISALRSGLSVFMSQYFIIASLFFVVPVYFQTTLGYDALQTGIKLVPLSIGLVVFSALGSRMSAKRSPRLIARLGQGAMAVGALIILSSIEPGLRSVLFVVGMLIIGAGFGLLASQLGNVNMSVVDKDSTSEVGGLQGTFQNLGTSFGTALVGSIFMLALSSGFAGSVQSDADLSQATKNHIVAEVENGVPIVTPQQAEQYVVEQGGSQSTAQSIADNYESSQVKALRVGMLFVVIVAVLSLLVSTNLPKRSTVRAG